RVTGHDVAPDDERSKRRDGDTQNADPVRGAAAEPRSEQPDDDRTDQRRQRNDQIKRHHRHRGHPFNWPRSSTSIDPTLRNSSTRRASPIADSAAATVRMKNTNTWPAMSFRKKENEMKFRLTASSMSSMAISRMITFLRFKKMPAMLMAKRIAPSTR